MKERTQDWKGRTYILIEKLKVKVQRNGTFYVGMILAAIICFAYYFEQQMNPQDTTVFAFSYKYGFISRGFMGTLLLLVNKISPVDAMSYHTVYQMSMAATILFFIMLFVLYAVLLYKVEEKQERTMQFFILILSILAFPEFLTLENFGRLDVYLAILMLACVIILLIEKAEWLVIPLCALATIIHQGFVFMNINIILVMLLYKAFRCQGKIRKKYLVIFGITFLTVSALFLYFELFSHMNGQEIYDEVVALAKKLSMDGESVNDSLLKHEILGEDVFAYEWGFHILNYEETPLFLLMFSPFILLGIGFFRRLCKALQTKEQKFIYGIVIAGAITVLPEAILKIDYGRYSYAILFYYILMVMILFAWRDNFVEVEAGNTYKRIRQKMDAPAMMILYLIMMVPFRDVRFNELICGIMMWIFRIF